VVSITFAAKIVGRSRQTIYNWMLKGRIIYIRDAGGHPLIIYSSLFLPTVGEKDGAIYQVTEAQSKAISEVYTKP
jgi:hypothetical protein